MDKPKISLETIAFQYKSSTVELLRKVFQLPIDYLRRLDNELGTAETKIHEYTSAMKYQKFKEYCQELFDTELRKVVKKEFNIEMATITVFPVGTDPGLIGMSLQQNKGKNANILFAYIDTIAGHRYNKSKKNMRQMFEELKKGINEKDAAIMLSQDKFRMEMNFYFSLQQSYLADRTAIIKPPKGKTYCPTADELTAIFLHEVGHFFTLITMTADHIYKGQYGNHILQNNYKIIKEMVIKGDTSGLKKNTEELKEIALTYIKDNSKNNVASSLETDKKSEEIIEKLIKSKFESYPFFIEKFKMFITAIWNLMVISSMVKLILRGFGMRMLQEIFQQSVVMKHLLLSFAKVPNLSSMYSQEIFSEYRGAALSERAADEFVSRYQMGTHLITGLEKIHSLFSRNRLRGINLTEANSDLYLLRVGYVLLSAISNPFAEIISSADSSPSSYEILTVRMRRMAQNQLVAFKSMNLHPSMRAGFINEYEDILIKLDEFEKTHNKIKAINILPKIVNFLIEDVVHEVASSILSTMTQTEIIKMLDSFDNLMANKAYYYSHKIGSLRG